MHAAGNQCRSFGFTIPTSAQYQPVLVSLSLFGPNEIKGQSSCGIVRIVVPKIDIELRNVQGIVQRAES